MNIIITGGTKGIGRAIAEVFAAQGFNIAVCARSKEDLIALKEEFSVRFPDITVLIQSVDVRDKQAVLNFAKLVLQKWAKIDILVNNVGVFLPGEIHQEPEGILEQLIETNLYSAYHLTRALLPTMLAAKNGHIFNMCSVASLKAYPNGGSYSISKFALLGFSKGLREELKDKGIKVISVMPGATWSDSWAGVELPESRLMQANDIAKIILAVYQLGDTAVVEEIVLRPQLGDL